MTKRDYKYSENVSSAVDIDGIKFSKSEDYGIYVHIPFCRSKCSYCAFCSTTELGLQNAYIDALEKEILSFGRIDKFTADTVYIGGGTPSCLYEGAITRIFDAIGKAFNISKNAEITVEMNPESCTRELLTECRSCGVNRVSMGMQSADDGVLRAVNRIHDFKTYLSAIELLKAENFDNISTDFILGLPNQTVADIEKCIEVAGAHCSHVSVYALTVEEGTPLYLSEYRPDDDIVADMYDLACERLQENGFIRYEVSNFAKNGRVSRHNSKYWRCVPYLGLGAAAHGYDGDRIRYSHTTDIKAYIGGAAVEVAQLTDKDMYNEYIMLGLRTSGGISREAFKARFGCTLDERAGNNLSLLVRHGLLIDDGASVRISHDKLFVMNGIIEDLMI